MSFWQVASPREEYFPYGSASDRRDARNRYRFIGVERDEDTGLCITGPRTYDPGIGRFLQGDLILSAGWSPFAYSRASPSAQTDRNGLNPRIDADIEATMSLQREVTARELDNSPVDGTAVTVLLGGAGNEPETVGYATRMANTMAQEGVPGPIKYVPISSVQMPLPLEQPTNVFQTLRQRSTVAGDSSGSAWDLTTRKVRDAFDPAATSRNLIGYSYGSVVAAQTALAMSASGERVDNLILLGSPIDPSSQLAAALQSDPNIGRVTWLDIPGDPFSAGIHPSELPDMQRHFHFIDQEQKELARVVAGQMRAGPESARIQVPNRLLDSDLNVGAGQ